MDLWAGWERYPVEKWTEDQCGHCDKLGTVKTKKKHVKHGFNKGNCLSFWRAKRGKVLWCLLKEDRKEIVFGKPT